MTYVVISAIFCSFCCLFGKTEIAKLNCLTSRVGGKISIPSVPSAWTWGHLELASHALLSHEIHFLSGYPQEIEKYRTVVYCFYLDFTVLSCLSFYTVLSYLGLLCYVNRYYVVVSNGVAFHAHLGKRFWKAYIVEGGCLNHQSTITWYLVYIVCIYIVCIIINYYIYITYIYISIILYNIHSFIYPSLMYSWEYSMIRDISAFAQPQPGILRTNIGPLCIARRSLASNRWRVRPSSRYQRMLDGSSN